jgi:hypothetical protein
LFRNREISIVGKLCEEGGGRGGGGGEEEGKKRRNLLKSLGFVRALKGS